MRTSVHTLKTIALFTALLAGPVLTHAVEPVGSAPTKNVIFLTFDGVRFQDVYRGITKPWVAKEKRGTKLFTRLLNRVKRGQAYSFGDPHDGERMWIGDTAALSLPGYQAMMSGQFERECTENDCGNTRHETFFDTLINQGFQKKELAVFSSWDQIGNAIESVPGRITRNIYDEAFTDEEATPEEAAWLSGLVQAYQTDKPTKWGGSRFDKYTWELGNYYLKKHRPRALYLSFIESDEQGHQKDYRAYLATLRYYDEKIEELVNTLANLGEYGANTSIVISTDHGRDPWFLWNGHSKILANRIFAFVIPSANELRSGRISKRKAKNYSHLELRPTLEALMGVKVPASDLRCGRSLVEWK